MVIWASGRMLLYKLSACKSRNYQPRYALIYIQCSVYTPPCVHIALLRLLRAHLMDRTAVLIASVSAMCFLSETIFGTDTESTVELEYQTVVCPLLACLVLSHSFLMKWRSKVLDWKVWSRQRSIRGWPPPGNILVRAIHSISSAHFCSVRVRSSIYIPSLLGRCVFVFLLLSSCV